MDFSRRIRVHVPGKVSTAQTPSAPLRACRQFASRTAWPSGSHSLAPSARSLQPGKHPRPLTRKEVPAIPPSLGAYFHASLCRTDGCAIRQVVREAAQGIRSSLDAGPTAPSPAAAPSSPASTSTAATSLNSPTAHAHAGRSRTRPSTSQAARLPPRTQLRPRQGHPGERARRAQPARLRTAHRLRTRRNTLAAGPAAARHTLPPVRVPAPSPNASCSPRGPCS